MNARVPPGDVVVLDAPRVVLLEAVGPQLREQAALVLWRSGEFDTATIATLLGTVEAAIVGDLARGRAPRHIRVAAIQDGVARHYGISRDDLLSADRGAVFVRARQVAMFLARALTPKSLPEIGRLFGDRDHTTVLHGVHRIEALCATDDGLRDTVAGLRRTLEGA